MAESLAQREVASLGALIDRLNRRGDEGGGSLQIPYAIVYTAHTLQDF
ncbi:MAG: hypothetical protein WBC73_16330 [Phormidesmis sp.]